jgi:hypothetical protein
LRTAPACSALGRSKRLLSMAFTVISLLARRAWTVTLLC